LTVLPADTAAVAMAVGQDEGALVPKKIAASTARPIASSRSGPDLAPHVVRRIVEDGFGDRDDRRELFRVQVLVRPVDLGRLLEARVAVDEVGDRQGRHDRDALLAARHRDVAKELQGGRLLNRAPSDLGRHLFGDGRRGVGPRDDVGVGHEGSPCE
jgi:hypothetical protein